MRARAVPMVAMVAGLLAGCAGSSKPASTSPEPQASGDDAATHYARVLIELQDDILASYERDDPPELDTSMIVSKIGAARIGAGPGDVYIAGDLARAPSRWPLDIDRLTRTDVRSKKLEIQIAADFTAAWMADELSWRIEACGRTAVIPLRITALYAHDGDRWVPVFEHLSFGWTPAPRDGPPPKAIKTEVVSGDLRDELSGVLGRGLFRTPHDPQVVSQDPSALVLGPDAGDEWHGPAVLGARLPAGKLEDRRVGTVGRTPGEATVAYWIGNYIADIPAQPSAPAGKVRMRVTHVFEKRRLGKPDGKAKACGDDCRWILVQTHMSQPITDDELTQQVFGTALLSPKPLQLDCSDDTRALGP
ncbi:MAG TPA: hypothetical protein VLM79_15700 [Kofleriaceae bacterium]|nr:hypothetical protein [Kofleriaceae bacterium]